MKQKKKKLPCDIVAEDNTSWLNMLGKVADSNNIVDAVYPHIVQKSLESGAAPAKVAEIAEKSLMLDENISKYTALLCVNNWFWGGRQVYQFDDTLAELLEQQSKDDLNIDHAIFQQLPVEHFFVLRKSPNVQKSLGFFFSRVGDMMYISDIIEGETEHTYSVKIAENRTVSEIIGEAFVEEYGTKREIAPSLRKVSSEVALYMQFVVYLSAINAEIVPATSGAVVKRQAGQREYRSRAKSEMSEVGYRIGAAIRKSQSSREKVVYEGEHSKGSKKSPHVRRSHFHSYWTGSGENRQLIVKWVNTIFVNSSEKNDGSTVHKVK